MVSDIVISSGLFVACVYLAAIDESEEERVKRLDQEQAKVDKEKGKLEYFAAIIEEGLCHLGLSLVTSALVEGNSNI